MSNPLKFPTKVIRARVIAEYIRDAGYRGVVVFSCGNASEAIKAEDVYVIDVAHGGALRPGKWWSPAQIRQAWPDFFDATSGHLPAHLMVRIARAFRAHLGALDDKEYHIPTGSGETITCLRWAYPRTRFVAVYGGDEATVYEPDAPLNLVVSSGGTVVMNLHKSNAS